MLYLILFHGRSWVSKSMESQTAEFLTSVFKIGIQLELTPSAADCFVWVLLGKKIINNDSSDTEIDEL